MSSRFLWDTSPRTNSSLLLGCQNSGIELAAGKTAPSLGITSTILPERLARMPISSAIARHIAEVPNLDDAIRRSINLIFKGFSLGPYLAKLLPNLKIAHLHSDAVYSLPPQLHTITISISHSCNPLLINIGQLKHLRNLSLNINSKLKNFDSSPLMALTQSETLQLSIPFLSGILTSPSLIRFVQQARIREFNFVLASEGDFNACYNNFLRPRPEEPTFPLMEYLTSIGDIAVVGCSPLILEGKLLRILTHYPALVKLPPCSLQLSSDEMALFLRLPNLTHLAFFANIESQEGLNSGDTIAAACQHLSNLRALRILGSISTQQLDSILSRLPHLTDFELSSCRTPLSSFASLLKYDLPKRLKKLKLTDCLVSASWQSEWRN